MTSGNIADLKLNPATQKWEAVFKHRVLASSPDQEYVARVINGGFSKKAKALGVTGVRVISADGGEVQTASGETIAITPIRTVEQEFHINERFKIMQDYTEMVADGQLASALVTGEGGLGKTYTVMKALKAKGIKDISQMEVGARHANQRGFVVVKGFSTAKGLFRTLYENKNQIIVFDDCDQVLRDPNSVNLLKAALDSYDERTVTWNAEAGFGESDLPKTFLFTGGVIFISNMSKHKVPQAIRSRAMCADVSMTRPEVVERMRVIVQSEEFLPEFEMEHKLEALEFVAENANNPMITELNLRSLVNVVKARASKPDHWKRLGLYSMANS